MLRKFTGAIIFWIITSAVGAGAQQLTDFRQEVAKLNQACRDSFCFKPYKIKTIYRGHKGASNRELLSQLGLIAESQAQVWGDSILEGDYAAKGDTVLDEIKLLYVNAKAFGYLITYSETAWQIGDCNYDGIHDSTLKDCLPGRIIESSYVSMDLAQYYYDEKTMVHFEPNPTK
jgi:hypothetical protein